MRVAVILLAGCSFHRAVEPGAIDAVTGGDGVVAIDARAIDAIVTTPFCDPSDATLVACYPFEGSAVDASTHGHDALATTSTTYVAGEVGMAVAIDNNARLDVADSAAFDVAALTIEAWIAPDLKNFPTTRGGILDCDGQYGLFVGGTGIVTCTAGAAVSTAAAVATDTWTHVACTHDASSVTIYLDGLVAAVTPSTPMATGGTTGITLGGNNPPGGGDPLVGDLDQLRLFNAARSARQICFDAGKTICP